MKAIQVSKVGAPEVLTLRDLPVPTPKPNEAVVQIKASGVNFIDVYFREGRYPAALPFVNGQEAAGDGHRRLSERHPEVRRRNWLDFYFFARSFGR